MNHSNPGICAIMPTAASTRASSAITAPIPRTPSMAPGIKAETTARAAIIAVNKPIPVIP